MRWVAWAVGFVRGAAALAEAVATAAGRLLPLRRVDEPLPFAAGEARAMAAGAFRPLDAVHRGRGTATIWRLADGRLRQGAYLELAPLKGSTGNQNYELPAGFEAARFKSVVIYCKAFSVLFSRAALKPGA